MQDLRTGLINQEKESVSRNSLFSTDDLVAVRQMVENLNIIINHSNQFYDIKECVLSIKSLLKNIPKEDAGIAYLRKEGDSLMRDYKDCRIKLRYCDNLSPHEKDGLEKTRALIDEKFKSFTERFCNEDILIINNLLAGEQGSIQITQRVTDRSGKPEHELQQDLAVITVLLEQIKSCIKFACADQKAKFDSADQGHNYMEFTDDTAGSEYLASL